MSITIKITFIAILFLLIVISGFWLSKKAKPYPVLLFNVHKLISLAAFILGGIVIYNLQKGIEITSGHLLLISATGVLFIFSIITGGLLNLDKPFYKLFRLIHRILSPIVIILTAIIFYLIIK